jgi:hypothetical protein
MVDKERWKVFMFKGIYVARMSIFNQAIWLKGVASLTWQKTYDSGNVHQNLNANQLGRHCVQHLHNKLRDLGNPHKFGMTRATEFGRAQFLDIVLQKWFLMDPSFQVLELEEDSELEENLPTEAKRRNLPLGLGT